MLPEPQYIVKLLDTQKVENNMEIEEESQFKYDLPAPAGAMQNKPYRFKIEFNE